MKTLASALILLIVLSTAGCSDATEPEDSPIRLRTDRSTYVAGEVVTIRVTNLTARPIPYGLCGWILEGWDFQEGRWEVADQTRYCPLNQPILEPHHSDMRYYLLPGWISPATRYRIRVTEFEGVPSEQAVSNEFRVRAPEPR